MLKRTACCLLLMACAARLCDAKSPPAPKAKAAAPSAEWIAALEKLAPAKASVDAPQRKVLVFSLYTGFKHDVIPYVDRVVDVLGQKSGALQATQTTDIEALTPERLAEFDVLVLNNNCSIGPRRHLFLDELERNPKYRQLSAYEREKKAAALEQSMLDFVAGGKGLVVLHGAPTFLNNSAKFNAMVGGSFAFHLPAQKVTLRTVDADHPLVAAFRGQGPLVHQDEPYCFGGPYDKLDFRPLLEIDVKLLRDPKGQLAKQVRYAAWIKPYGKGRVFYCSPSHFHESYENPAVLRFLLDGIQYAAGDLKCDDSTPKPTPAATSKS